MSKLFENKPNIVRVELSDKSGTAERFVVGKDLDEAIAIVEAAFSQETVEKKARRKRRTKQELLADNGQQAKEFRTAEAPAPDKPKRGRKPKTEAGWPSTGSRELVTA